MTAPIRAANFRWVWFSNVIVVYSAFSCSEKRVLSAHSHNCWTVLFLGMSKQDNNFPWPSPPWNDYTDIKVWYKFFQSLLLHQCSNTKTLPLGEINYWTDNVCHEVSFSYCIIIQIWNMNSSYSKQLKIAHTGNSYRQLLPCRRNVK